MTHRRPRASVVGHSSARASNRAYLRLIIMVVLGGLSVQIYNSKRLGIVKRVCGVPPFYGENLGRPPVGSTRARVVRKQFWFRAAGTWTASCLASGTRRQGSARLPWCSRPPPAPPHRSP